MTRLEKAVAIGSIASSCAAAVALLWNVYVFDSALERQNQTATVELYQSYLSLALQHPDFAFENRDIADRSEEEGKRYLIFATAALTIAERIYELDEGKSNSTEVVAGIVRTHAQFVEIECERINPNFLEFIVSEIDGFGHITCS